MTVPPSTAVARVEAARPLALPARLHCGGRARAGHVAAASRTSFLVELEGAAPADRATFERVVVTAGGRDLDLGACRFHAGGQGRFAGRLVLLSRVYDAPALIESGELVTLAGHTSATMELLLGIKSSVRPSFRVFVADAMHDFSVWRHFLDEQEKAIADEPPDVAEAAREAIVAMHYDEFFAFFDRHSEQLLAEVKDFTRAEHERHASYFRRNAWPYISASAMLRRTNEKPSGYAGDAEMMRLLYENRYVGASAFEWLMHAYPVRVPAALAVRNRLRMVPEALRAAQARFAARGVRDFKFLSVAAGPACELDAIYRTADDALRIEGTLLDQDVNALATGRDNVARIERVRATPLRMNYVQESVRTMLRPHSGERLGRYHFIYSMGLFDYLGSAVARAVLGKLYELLLPGGEAVIGNYHVANPSRFYMDYWADWPLLYRSEAQFLGLAADLAGAETNVRFDPSGSQMFLTVRRPHDP